MPQVYSNPNLNVCSHDFKSSPFCHRGAERLALSFLFIALVLDLDVLKLVSGEGEIISATSLVNYIFSL